MEDLRNEIKNIIADLEDELSVVQNENSDAYTTRQIIIDRLENLL